MRKILAFAAVAIIGLAGAAYAADQAQDKTTKPAISTEQMKAQIDKLGYDVQHLKRGDGAYKMHLIDRETGGRVEARFDGKTGELVRARLARAEHEADARDETAEQRKSGEQKAGAHKEREDRDDEREDRD